MSLSKKIFAAVLVFINFLLLHYIISSIPLRFDFTKDGIYTLSESTKSMLSKIEEPVSIDFYTSKSIGDVQAWFKNFSDRVEEMLKQYEKVSGGKIRLNVIDPKPDSEEEERAIASGVSGTEIATGDKIYLGMVVAQGGTEKVHPFFNWDRETFLEYDISKMVYETQLLTKPRLGLITSLPLLAPDYPAMPGQPAPSDQFFASQLKAQFEVISIDASESELPGDLDLLLLAHPQGIGDDLMYSIDQYALMGKPIFLALDPSSVNEMEQGRQQMMMGQMSQPSPSDLPALLEAWGVDYQADEVIVDPRNSLSQGRFNQPSWLVIRDNFTNRDLLPSAELEPVMLLGAGRLSQRQDATTEWEPVLQTSDEAGSVKGMILQFADAKQQLLQKDAFGSQATVAGLVSGPAKTAFPEGPTSSPEDEETESNGAENSEQLTSGNITVFIIADSDFMLDRFSIEKFDFFGTEQIRKLNDNQSLASNFVDYLGGSQDLIGVRGKASVTPPFEVVQKMESEAQAVYQTKLDAAEAQLQELSDRLNQLVSEQASSGVIYATPEMEAVINENQERQAELRAEIREIRRELRQGIKTLGNIVGTVNILWAPLALLAFALLYNRTRKKGA